MFTYLQKLLGKSISYYEMLMKSKTQQISITQKDIDSVNKQLKTIALHAVVYTEVSAQYNTMIPDHIEEIPTNEKGMPMQFKGSFILHDQLLTLFVDTDKNFNQCEKHRLCVTNFDSSHIEIKKILEKQRILKCRSYPIWEELIHRFLSIHKWIVSINKNHPWSLYTLACKNSEKSNYSVYIGGYPQWRINNVDYRTLKAMNFLLEYRQHDTNSSYYFFNCTTTKSIEMIMQKD